MMCVLMLMVVVVGVSGLATGSTVYGSDSPSFASSTLQIQKGADIWQELTNLVDNTFNLLNPDSHNNNNNNNNNNTLNNESSHNDTNNESINHEINNNKNINNNNNGHNSIPDRYDSYTNYEHNEIVHDDPNQQAYDGPNYAYDDHKNNKYDYDSSNYQYDQYDNTQDQKNPLKYTYDIHNTQEGEGNVNKHELTNQEMLASFIHDPTGKKFFADFYQRPGFGAFRRISDLLFRQFEFEEDRSYGSYEMDPYYHEMDISDGNLALVLLGLALIAQLLITTAYVASCTDTTADVCTTTCDNPNNDCLSRCFGIPVVCAITCDAQDPVCTTTCTKRRKKRGLNLPWGEEGGLIQRAAETLRQSRIGQVLEGLNLLPDEETGRTMCNNAGRFLE